MIKKTFLGAALGFIINFQSAYNPFYIPNWFVEKHNSYYIPSDYVNKEQVAMNRIIPYYEQNRN